MKRRLVVLRLMSVALTVTFSFALTAALTIAPAAIGFGWPYSSRIGSMLAVFSWTFGLVAWVALLIMGIAWALERRVHRSIPVIGTAIGIVSVLPWVPTVLPIVTLAPALFMAVRLVYYHLQLSQ